MPTVSQVALAPHTFLNLAETGDGGAVSGTWGHRGRPADDKARDK